MTEGRKDDQDKPRWDLLPGDALEEITRVLTFGAKKYGDRNWEKGMAWGRCFGALMRHMWAWWAGEEKDKETGLSHLAHAGCCLLFLLSFALRKVGTDDRPKAEFSSHPVVLQECRNCAYYGQRHNENNTKEIGWCVKHEIATQFDYTCDKYKEDNTPGRILHTNPL